MLIELKNLEEMPVGSFDEQIMIGRVYQTIVSPEEGKLLGFLVKIGTFIPKFKVASMQDVVDIDQNGIALRSTDSLVEKDEVVRIAEILKHKFNLIGLPAKNKKDQNMGRVTNALIESQSGDILRVYVGSLLRERVFERSRIIKIEETKIVLDDSAEVKETAKAKLPEALVAKDLAGA